KLTEIYDAEKRPGESFAAVVERIGKARLKTELAELSELPTYEEDPSLYIDNRHTWQYHKSVGVGECAGEVVDQAEFMLEDADRLNFEATLALDAGNAREAAEKAYQAEAKAADALLSTRGFWLSDNYDRAAEFKK